MSLAKRVSSSSVRQNPKPTRDSGLPRFNPFRFCQHFLTNGQRVYWGAAIATLCIAQPFAGITFAASPPSSCAAKLTHKSQNHGVRCTTKLPPVGQQTLTQISQTVPPQNSDPDVLLLAKNSDPVLTLNHRGINLMNQGDYVTAQALFDQVLQLNPRYAPAFNNRAMVHVLMGDQDAAIQDYTQSISLKPDDADVYVNRGLAFATAEKASEALADYTAALQIEPQNAPALHARGGVYLSLNNRAAARADLQQAAALYFQQGDLQSYRDLADFIQHL
jgi:tetratricopeptide (TPR) repeat protein